MKLPEDVYARVNAALKRDSWLQSQGIVKIDDLVPIQDQERRCFALKSEHMAFELEQWYENLHCAREEAMETLKTSKREIERARANFEGYQKRIEAELSKLARRRLVQRGNVVDFEIAKLLETLGTAKSKLADFIDRKQQALTQARNVFSIKAINDAENYEQRMRKEIQVQEEREKAQLSSSSRNGSNQLIYCVVPAKVSRSRRKST